MIRQGGSLSPATPRDKSGGSHLEAPENVYTYHDFFPGRGRTDQNGGYAQWTVWPAFYAGLINAPTDAEWTAKIETPKYYGIMRCPGDPTTWRSSRLYSNNGVMVNAQIPTVSVLSNCVFLGRPKQICEHTDAD